MNIEIIGNDCCGCQACLQICPKKCILMKESYDGFLYPTIQQNLCINCSLCINACPVYNNNSLSDDIICSYVGYNKDNHVRLLSSSGGLFDIFAKHILLENGVVFGAMFDECNKLVHNYITNYDDIQKLRGSKYLQSNINNSYTVCKKILDQGKKVLFTGVPCQISGLKKYLSKEYENLYTIDVLCHGVPSPKLFNMYLSEKHFEKNTNICFRRKDYGWRNFSISFTDGEKKYSNVHSKDIYMKIFLNNLSLRECCYNCKFKSLKRESDITIGDAWGIEKHSPELDDNKGTSVVIIHSNKGDYLLKSNLDNLMLKKVDIDIALPKTSDSRKSVKRNKNREKFFNGLQQGISINNLSKLSCDKTFLKKFLRKLKRILNSILKKLTGIV